MAAAAVLARPAAPIPAAETPRASKQPSPQAAIAALVGDPGGVIAFGELHQTRATAKVRSAIARFTDEILPIVAPHASHLIVETWIARGTCGAVEAQSGVGFGEVVVRADLDRPVAGVLDHDGRGRAAGIELELAVVDEQGAGGVGGGRRAAAHREASAPCAPAFALGAARRLMRSAGAR